MSKKYSPMMMQYLKIKEANKDVLILFRLGDFYELFFDDAKIASKELQLALTGKNAGVDERVPMCGVPHHAVKTYIAKLINRGYRVGIVEQMTDPSASKGIVERDVVQIITPGAFMDVNSNDNNYIASLDETDYCYILSYADLSTGEINVMNLDKDINNVISELDNLLVNELIVQSSFDIKTIDYLKSKRNILISYEDNNEIELEFEGVLQEVKDVFQMRSIMRLIHYFKRTQKRGLEYLQVAKVIKTNKILQIDNFSKLNLELTRTIRSEEKYGSLYWLLDETKTAMGARLLKNWIYKPSADIDEIISRQNMIQAFVDDFMTRNDVRLLLDEVYDLERLIARISFGNVNGRDMLQLKNSLKPINNLKTLLHNLNNTYINELVDKMADFSHVVTLLESAISDDAPLSIKEGGIFKSNYSQELDEIVSLSHGGKKWVAELEEKERERTGIKTLKIGYNRVFGYYIEISKGAKNLIQDEWGYERKQTTINGERFITQELKEKEALILNADERRMRLEYELFLQIRKIIKSETVKIQKLANALAKVDVIASLALVSVNKKFVRPKFNFERKVEIEEGKHPVIEEVLKDHRYVANDIVFEEDNEILLITGPNMGGKSTYMRQLAIIVIMAQMGCFVPAKSANLMIFDQIFTRIGASDDLVSGQSTFMVEMNETNYALRHASENSLLIFDEIGRGTATFDGMALAQAIIEYIAMRIHCKTMFSTHYHELTTLEKQIPSLKNVHVLVKDNNDTITFLYKIENGTMKKSYGINVARLAHLPDELLERAKEILLTLEKKEIKTSMDVLVRKEPTEEAWIKEVKELDPLNMSPLEALNYLYELKKKIK